MPQTKLKRQMETTTTPTTTPQDPVKGQFAAALRQYQYSSHGRSIRKFCEDEGQDYQKFFTAKS